MEANTLPAKAKTCSSCKLAHKACDKAGPPCGRCAKNEDLAQKCTYYWKTPDAASHHPSNPPDRAQAESSNKSPFEKANSSSKRRSRVSKPDAVPLASDASASAGSAPADSSKDTIAAPLAEEAPHPYAMDAHATRGHWRAPMIELRDAKYELPKGVNTPFLVVNEDSSEQEAIRTEAEARPRCISAHCYARTSPDSPSLSLLTVCVSRHLDGGRHRCCASKGRGC